MKVSEIMSTEIVFATTTDSICNIAKLMNENHVGSIPICNENEEIVGIVTDRDIILRSIACDKDIKETKITEIMTTDIWSITPDTDICEATTIMKENQIRRLPVVENSKIIGILSIGDLIRSKKTDEHQVNDTMECICNCNKNC